MVRRGMPALLVSVLVLASCGDDDPATSASARRVSDREQRQLPTDQYGLAADVCPQEWNDGDLSESEVRRYQAAGRRKLAALERAYARDPDALVRTTYASSDEGPGEEDMTVRELARTHLDGATEPDLAGSACEKRLARRLRALLAG